MPIPPRVELRLHAQISEPHRRVKVIHKRVVRKACVSRFVTWLIGTNLSHDVITTICEKLLGYLTECSVDKAVDRKTRKTGFTRAGGCYAVTFQRIDRIKLQVVVVNETNEKVGVEVSTTKQGSEKGMCCFHKRKGVREIQALLPPVPQCRTRQGGDFVLPC